MAGSDVGENGWVVGGSAPAPPSQDPCAPLRLAAAAAWQVVRARQVRDFPRVLGLLEAVGQAAPDIVCFRHYARLRLGLQAAVIMGMLQEEQPDGKIYHAVDTYFPEGEHQRHPLATPRDLRLVGEAQETFRELVLGLLSDRQRRETYVEEQLEAEYGEPFLGGLEGLLYEYLVRLESSLSPPQLQQLQEAAWSECPLAGSPQRPPQLGILAQYLTDMGHHQPTGLVTSAPSLPQPGAEQPLPRTPGSHQGQSQEGAAPAQEEMPPDLGLHCQPPEEQDLGAGASGEPRSPCVCPHPHARRNQEPGCVPMVNPEGGALVPIPTHPCETEVGLNPGVRGHMCNALLPPDASRDIVWESEEEESCCPRRKVPWLLRSRDPAPSRRGSSPAPRHRCVSLRRVPHKASYW